MKEKLESVQGKIKSWFDQHKEHHTFSPADQALSLFPIVSSPFHAKFVEPYMVMKQVSDQSYINSTSEQRKSMQLCHVNLLKPYYSCMGGTVV